MAPRETTTAGQSRQQPRTRGSTLAILGLAAMATTAFDCESFTRGIFGPVTPTSHRVGSGRSRAEVEQQKKEFASYCSSVIDPLKAGDWYVASPEKTPRAKELLAWECDHRPEHDARPNDAWLFKTNPALCERLRHSPPAEAFRFVPEGDEWAFEYFGFEETGTAPRVVEVYSHFKIHVAVLACVLDPWSPDRPQMSFAEESVYRSTKNDKGSAPWTRARYGENLVSVSLYPNGQEYWQAPNDGSKVGLLLPNGARFGKDGFVYLRRSGQRK